MADAQKEAYDALAGYLLVQEDTHSPISDPKKPRGQITAGSGDQVIAVTVDTEKER